MEQRWSVQSSPWAGYVNFTKVIFRPIKRLELFGKLKLLFRVV